MSVTLESLENRLAELEKAVAALRQMVTADPHGRQSRADQAALAAITYRVFREMGIPPGPPTMTAEELQKQMIADGVRPEDNLGSREIIRMREE